MSDKVEKVVSAISGCKDIHGRPLGHVRSISEMREIAEAALAALAPAEGEDRCDCGHTIEDCAARPGLRHCETAIRAAAAPDHVNQAYKDATFGAAGMLRMHSDGNVERIPPQDWRAND